MGADQSSPSYHSSPNPREISNFSKTYSQVPRKSDLKASATQLAHTQSFGNIPYQLPSNVQSRLTPKPTNIEKVIFIEADNGKRVKICFQTSEEDNLTCGWLVSETIRQFADSKIQEPYPNRPIVALQTLDEIISLDYWLSDLERSVRVLRDGMVLKPFYGNTEYNVKNQKINLTFFYLLKVIGTGGFSKVYLGIDYCYILSKGIIARRKDNGQFYAIKVISKKEMLKKDKEEAVFNERNVMARLKHPFLVSLSFAFQTNDKLFLVMDFCPGGELFYHLQQRKKLREEEVKIYMGEIILALNYLHKNNIIFRDLKPENILLDIDGHLHLADFGLCKVTHDKKDLNYTFCGSPEYMAPEVIEKSGYNFSADFYALGVLVYEMVVGRPPFFANWHRELYQKILNEEVTYPAHISPNLKMFLSQLLEKNPKERLGSKAGLSEIVNHPWCNDIDFVKIASKKIKAPIVPDLYKTNFAREFIDARISCMEDNLPNNLADLSPNGPMSAYSYTDSAVELDGNPGMYRKFANFSFYSNIDDPYEKFQDSIFGSNGNTPDTSPKTARRASRMATILTPEVLGELQERLSAGREKVEKINIQKIDTVKEDFTEDLNERSPYSNINQYKKIEAKLAKPERSMTPRFPDQTFSSEANRALSARKLPPNYGTHKQDSTKNAPLSYHGLNFNSSRMVPEQTPNKNVTTSANPLFRQKTYELQSNGRLDEISEEIVSGNDKPLTHMNNLNRLTSYKESQLSYRAGLSNTAQVENRTGPRIGLDKTQTYSFMTYDERIDDKFSIKELTSDFLARTADTKGSNKITIGGRAVYK